MSTAKPNPRIEAALNIHVGKNHTEVPAKTKLELLHQKKRRIRFMLFINMAAIVFFAYWFWSGITQLPGPVFYFLSVVFILNVVVLQIQKKQVEGAIEYLYSMEAEPDSG